MKRDHDRGTGLSMRPLAAALGGIALAASALVSSGCAGGADAEQAFSKSTICGTMAPTELGALRAADGAEGLKAK